MYIPPIVFKDLINMLLFDKDRSFDWSDTEPLLSAMAKNFLFRDLSVFGIFVYHISNFIMENYILKSITETQDDVDQGLSYEFWEAMCISVLKKNVINKEDYEKSRDVRTDKDILSRIIGR